MSPMFIAGQAVECNSPPVNHSQHCVHGIVKYRVPFSSCYAVQVGSQTLVFDASYMRPLP